ncbi:hypothetical protein [Nocardia sp. NPDC050175]|uniref:hypothetical protein n=1 Tax=Nocardia sp. NPDC050175 TaxID=3364317 RepID=UPI0037B27F16
MIGSEQPDHQAARLLVVEHLPTDHEAGKLPIATASYVGAAGCPYSLGLNSVVCSVVGTDVTVAARI